MNSFLNACCVFDYLLDKKKVLQVVNGTTWKNINPTQNTPYVCSFFINKRERICLVSFQIIIYKGKHCIKLESVESLLDGITIKEAKHVKYVLTNCIL